MRVLQHLGNSALDFVENSRLGAAGFRLARLGMFALMILVVTRVASGQFLAFDWKDVLFIGIAAVMFLVVFWRREIGLIFILASTSFIIYNDMIPTLSLYHFVPEIRILETLRLQIGQGLLLYLLAVYALSPEARTARQRLATPLLPALLAFMFAILLASIVGVVFGGVRLPDMVETARHYSYYLVFLVTLLCVRSRRELRVLQFTFLVMAIVVAILMAVQFAVGDRVRVFISRGVRVESFGQRAGRILPPGVELIAAAVPFLIARIPTVSGNDRRTLIAAFWVLLGGVLLCFTRAVWMGVLFAMVIMTILGRGEVRRGVLRMFVAMGVGVGILLTILALISTEREDYATPYIRRFTSVFKSESYGQGSTANVRLEEIKAAWPRILEHPWSGVGVGGYYRYKEEWDDLSQQNYMAGIRYMHNAYFLLLTHAGVPGFSTCMIMYITFFVRARSILRKIRRPEDRSLVMAGIAAVASVMLASLMQPSLWYAPAVAVMGLTFGIVELLRYFTDQELLQAAEARELAEVAAHREDRNRPVLAPPGGKPLGPQVPAPSFRDS